MAKSRRQIEELAQMFRVLGDQTRLRILLMLQNDEFNVTQMCKKLRMHQPTVSRHLGILRMGGLVGTRRNGKEIFYSLKDLRLNAYTRGMQSMLGKAAVLRIGPMVMGLTKS